MLMPGQKKSGALLKVTIVVSRLDTEGVGVSHHSSDSKHGHEEIGFLGQHPILILLLALLGAVALWYFWIWAGFPGWARAMLLEEAARVSIQAPSASSAEPASSPAPTKAEVLAELGQTGDSFGGLNSLLTSLAGAFVLWAGAMQYQALKLARADSKREQEARIRSENLAKETLRITQEALVAQHRAWLQVTPSLSGGEGTTVRMLEGYVSMPLNLKIENVGLTPAIMVTSSVRMVLASESQDVNLGTTELRNDVAMWRQALPDEFKVQFVIASRDSVHLQRGASVKVPTENLAERVASGMHF